MENNHLHDEIRKLRKEKEKFQGFFTLACIGLIIFALLYFSANSLSTKQKDMIDTCTSEISTLSSTLNDANDSVGSMSEQLGSISSDAGDAAGSDYDTQASTLDDISNTANDAQNTGGDFTPPSTTCAQIDNGSSSSD